MAHGLFKSEPSAWSFEKLARLGAPAWTGAASRSFRRTQHAGDEGRRAGIFLPFQRGQGDRGIVEVCKAYRPDPTDASGTFGMVDIRAVRPLPRPVTLEEAKTDRRLAGMALVTNSRLSVQPVTDADGRTS